MKTWEIIIDHESKIVVKIMKIPEGFRFAMTYLFFLEDWTDIARIDNYPHDRKEGVHIHRLGSERVEFRDIGFEEAKETLLNIGNKIKERLKNDYDKTC